MKTPKTKIAATNTLQLVIEQRAKEKLKNDLLAELRKIKELPLLQLAGQVNNSYVGIKIRAQDLSIYHRSFKPKPEETEGVTTFFKSLSDSISINWFLRDNEDGEYYKKAFTYLLPSYIENETAEIVARLDNLENEVNDLKDNLGY